jgi:hypothetical protein
VHESVLFLGGIPVVDEFKFTENSAKLMMEVELGGALFSAKLKELREKGVPPEEAVRLASGSDNPFGEMAKMMFVQNKLVQMGFLLRLESPTDWRSNRSLTGIVAWQQYYVDSDVAKRWDVMYIACKTNRDIWNWFLQENEMSEKDITKVPGYDDAFFQAYLGEDYDQQMEFQVHSGDMRAYDAMKAYVDKLPDD